MLWRALRSVDGPLTPERSGRLTGFCGAKSRGVELSIGWFRVHRVALFVVLGVMPVLGPRCGGDGRSKTVTRTIRSDTTVAVPDVRGKGIAEARRVLLQVGLRTNFHRQVSKKSAGDVLQQSPTPGVRVDHAAVIDLTVARKAKLNPPPPSNPAPAQEQTQSAPQSPSPDPNNPNEVIPPGEPGQTAGNPCRLPEGSRLVCHD